MTAHIHHAPPRTPRADRGAAAAELAIAAPLLITALLLILQLLAWGLAALAAHAAADHAAQTTRTLDGSPGAGHVDAATELHNLAGPLIADATVHIDRRAQTTTVTITGHAHGLPLPVHATVHAPTERPTR